MHPASTTTIQLGSIRIDFRVEAGDSNGSVTVFECFVPVDSRVPMPHSHDGFEETAYVLEGTCTWTVDGETRESGSDRGRDAPSRTDAGAAVGGRELVRGWKAHKRRPKSELPTATCLRHRLHTIRRTPRGALQRQSTGPPQQLRTAGPARSHPCLAGQRHAREAGRDVPSCCASSRGDGGVAAFVG